MQEQDTNLAFHGFRKDAAKNSCRISKILNHLIASAERDIEIVTSTPNFKGRMDASFSKHCNFHTMDHDSGYMSHNQESNSDSSLENLNETVLNMPSKPIYISEDALLEQPRLRVKLTNLNIKSDDEEETRKFGTDFERDDSMEYKNISSSPDIIVSTSVISQKTTYSGFDDSDSNTSLEIPPSKQIIVENVDNYCRNNDLRCNSIDCSLDISDGSNSVSYENIQDKSKNSCVSVSEHNSCLSSMKDCAMKREENKCYSALNNITNTCNVKNNEKRLTLIFSKNNKENVYSVKRKYQSTSPEKDTIEENDTILNKRNISPKKIQTLQHLSSKCDSVAASTTEYNENLLSVSLYRNFSAEKDESPMKVVNETLDVNDMDNSESPQKELILKKELDLEAIVLQQETVSTEKEKMMSGIQPEIKNQIECVPINPPSIATPTKKFENPIDPSISPDLFENEELIQEMANEPQPTNCIADEQYIIKKDQRLLKRVQNSLKGVLPPRSVTVTQMSVEEMLNRIEANKDYFWTKEAIDEVRSKNNSKKLKSSDESNNAGESMSLLVTGNQDCVDAEWPQILNERFHGLHHNRSKVSEETEDLLSKYQQRFVGAETQSSYTVFETNIVSPTKRKQTKQRWAVKSPGRRLSHLAKRKISFNSHLQGGASSSFVGSRARQILIDAKKIDLMNRRRSPRKSPRKNLRKSPRKTPNKSPRIKTRTPSSSAKKKLAMRFRELAGEIENTVPNASSEKLVLSSKRVLFQSPDRNRKTSLFQPSTSGLSGFENELKKPSTKRNLFPSPKKRSPLKKSPFKSSPFRRLDFGVDKKRKRTDCNDVPPSKLARSMSVDVRSSESELAAKFNRSRSEMSISLNKPYYGGAVELTAVHKKKLQWAVYEALRSQNITPSHAQFKVFASVLARVTRRFLPNLTSGAPKECGTTEKMQRIAHCHVYAVVKGKSVDEIVTEHLKNRMKNVKPQGYVAPENYNEKKGESSGKENASQGQCTKQENVDRKRLQQLSKPKTFVVENRIDRIRKVINFGDDNR